MPILTIVLIALGLSMDAFAVSIATGFQIKRLHVFHALRTALFFGLFQAVMPVIGWLAGMGLRPYIAALDHWVAFGLLLAIGAKMIYEAFSLGEDSADDPHSIYTLLVLSVATSVDALAVGLGLTFLQVAILLPAVVIGVITFAMCLAGGFIGQRFGHFFEKWIEAAGGIILIAIGSMILFRHLTA